MTTADSTTELDILRDQVTYLQAALDAIRSGGVDAVVAETGDRVYTLSSADRPYRVIIESMGEGAATVSGDGILLFANQQLAESLGQARDLLLGQHIASYVVADRRELRHLLDTAVGETRRAEVAFEHHDGSAVPMLVAATAVDLDDSLIRCLVMTDLTTQKEIERQLADEQARSAQRAERHLVAREVNDGIVQGLVAAEMALDLGRVDYARAVVARTSEEARAWIGELVDNERLEPGMSVRAHPAPGRSDQR